MDALSLSHSASPRHLLQGLKTQRAAPTTLSRHVTLHALNTLAARMAHAARFALLAAVCLLAAAGGRAVELSTGQCPVKKLVDNFDVSLYKGHWYQLRAYSQVYEVGGKCSQAEYTPDGPGRVKVRNTLFYSLTKKTGHIDGFAVLTSKLPNQPQKGDFSVTLDIPVIGKQTAPLQVLATDYNNFAVVYSCVHKAGVSAESAWILSRTPTVASPRVQGAIDKAVKDAGLKTSALKPTTQDCGKLV